MFCWLERLLVVNNDQIPDQADVIIGTGIDLNIRGDKASSQSHSVALKCLALWKEGVSKNILFTGGYYIHPCQVTEAWAMCDVIAWQIPWENIWLEQKSKRTYENADYTLKIIKEEGWKSVIIVTQQWHARRVKVTFIKRWLNQGIRIYAIKAWSQYSNGFQTCLNSWFRFSLWDTLAFIY